MTTTERPTALVKTVLSGVLLGVDASKVESIEDGRAFLREETKSTIDVAPLLGIASPPPNSPRRALMIRVEELERIIVVGESAKVEPIDPESLRAVPVFLQGLRAKTAIQWVFISEKGLGFVLDTDHLGKADTEELKK